VVHLHVPIPSGVTTRAPSNPQTTPAELSRPVDDRTDRAVAAAFDREQKRRARQALGEEAAQKKEQERRDRATAAAEAALEEGKRIHQANLADLEKAQQALDK
jgi:colicin import membrane protein